MKPRITADVAYVVFVTVFFPIWFVTSLLHIHRVPGLVLAIILSALTAWCGAPLWMRVYNRPKPTAKDYRNPALGNRAERRKMAKKHRPSD